MIFLFHSAWTSIWSQVRLVGPWRGRPGIAVVAIAMCSLLLTVSGPSSAARRADTSVYSYSSVPYWKVGSYSPRLSKACQERQFGQKRHFRYVIGFVGDEGRAITGIASSTWNLYDPTGLAAPSETYHFFNDGYSDCAVYVAPQPRN